jgi:hypothetical protein
MVELKKTNFIRFLYPGVEEKILILLNRGFIAKVYGKNGQK